MVWCACLATEVSCRHTGLDSGILSLKYECKSIGNALAGQDLGLDICVIAGVARPPLETGRDIWNTSNEKIKKKTKKQCETMMSGTHRFEVRTSAF